MEVKDETEVITETEETAYEADGVDEEIAEEEDFEVEEAETEEETAEEETAEEETEDESDDFEYDEDGNIIIPDDEEESAAEEESDGEEAEGDGEGAEAVTEPDSTPVETESDEKHTEPDARDLENAELRRQLAELQAVAKDAIAKLGVESTDDALMGLAELAGETEGITAEQYMTRKREADKEAMQRELAQKLAFEQLAREDLAALQAAFPETQAYKTLRDMPHDILTKFGRYRDMGLPAKEAYAAANPDGIRSTVATAARQKSLRESKSHLSSAVPQSARDTSTARMTKSELEEWRGYFPKLSDKEIVALYRKTK